MNNQPKPANSSEDNEPALYVDLEYRKHYGDFQRTVTYTVDGEEEAFFEVPYRAHRSYGPEFDHAVRAGIEAGRRYERRDREES